MAAASPDAAVAVVGAGPVGQTTALLLARWGIPVLLLDAQPARDLVGSKSIVQQRDVLDIWAAVGAGQQIAAEGLTWTRARTFYRDRELFCLTFADRGRSAFPPFVNIAQSRTEQILADRLATSPLVEQRWGHEVSTIQPGPSGVTLGCRTAAGLVTVRAPYAVVCAGARADALRSQLGIGFPGRSFNDHFLICDIRADLGGQDQERRFYFDPVWNPGRQVLIHPCPGSVYRIDWQVPPDFDLAAEESTGGLDRRIRQILGDRPYEVVWRSVYRFQARHADRLRVGRVLVAGDSAHLVSPFGARGLNSGVQDAENAAWKLAFVLHGWAGDRLLASYHDERLAAALENLDVTSRTMDFLVPQTEAAQRHRLAVLDRALTDPSAAAQVDSGRLAEPYWYVDSPLTTPDPGRPFPGRPPRGQAPAVVPGVLVPDGPVELAGQPAAGQPAAGQPAAGQQGVTRLRELVRDGLLALTGPGADPAAVADTLRSATAAPTRALALAAVDPTGALAAALGAGPRECWLIRPDGHVAAVLPGPDPAGLRAAVARCLAADPTGPAPSPPRPT